MSAFKEALQNIDDIKIDEKAKGLFIETLTRLNNFFSYNDLLDVIDYKKLFKNYLYSNNGKNKEALSVIFHSKEDLNNKDSEINKFIDKTFYNDVKTKILENLKNDIGENNSKFLELFEEYKKSTKSTVGGFYVSTDNTMNILERDKFDKKINTDDLQLHNMIHEFIHMLTLKGDLEYVEDGIRYIVSQDTVRQLDNKKHIKKNLYFNGMNKHTDTRLIKGFCEAGTQSLTNSIFQLEKVTSYPIGVALYDMMSNLFYREKRYTGFLRRQTSDFDYLFAPEIFNQILDTMLNYADNAEPSNKETVDLIRAQKNIFITYLNLIKKDIINMTPIKFVTEMARVYNNIPFKAYNNFKNELNPVFSFYSKTMLNNLGMEATDGNIKTISDKLINAFDNKVLFDIEKTQNIKLVKFNIGKEVYSAGIVKDGFIIGCDSIHKNTFEEDIIDSAFIKLDKLEGAENSMAFKHFIIPKMKIMSLDHITYEKKNDNYIEIVSEGNGVARLNYDNKVLKIVQNDIIKEYVFSKNSFYEKGFENINNEINNAIINLHQGYENNNTK